MQAHGFHMIDNNAAVGTVRDRRIPTRSIIAGGCDYCVEVRKVALAELDHVGPWVETHDFVSAEVVLEGERVWSMAANSGSVFVEALASGVADCEADGLLGQPADRAVVDQGVERIGQ